MRRRGFVAAGVVLAVGGVAVTAGSAYAYFWEQSRSDVIANGVTVAGVDVGGLHATEAQRLLEQRLGGKLFKPVYLVYGRRRFTVAPVKVGLRVDVAGMVERAVAESRDGNLAHRFIRDIRGDSLDASIPLRSSLLLPALRAVSGRVARAVDVAARNARIVTSPLATSLRVVPSRTGLAVKRPLLERRLAAALVRTEDLRAVAVPTRPVYPRWQTSTLARRFGTYLLISRETFTLRLYKHLKLAKRYPIAVGRAGLETPAGLYSIDDKQVNPSWHVPLSSWAGSLAGKVIPPGPDDPIKARWLGFYNGAGIHGTEETWSLGSAASHGCIRMRIPDVEELYDLVPLHTPIYVG